MVEKGKYIEFAAAMNEKWNDENINSIPSTDMAIIIELSKKIIELEKRISKIESGNSRKME